MRRKKRRGRGAAHNGARTPRVLGNAVRFYAGRKVLAAVIQKLSQVLGST